MARKDVCKTSSDHTVLYDVKWDAHLCKDCKAWLEDVCGDASCALCKGRPERPEEFERSEDDLYPIMDLNEEVE